MSPSTRQLLRACSSLAASTARVVLDDDEPWSPRGAAWAYDGSAVDLEDEESCAARLFDDAGHRDDDDDVVKSGRRLFQDPKSPPPPRPPAFGTPEQRPGFGDGATDAVPRRAPPSPARPAIDDDSLEDARVLVGTSDTPRTMAELTVLRRIGAGQFAEVVEVEAAGGKRYAVKRAQEPFRSRKARDVALAEARTLEALGHHSNVVVFHRAWQESRHLHVLLELCALGDVARIASGRPVPADCVWKLVRDVGTGLAHVHAHGYAHLDVKPANVLVAADGVLKLADFGLAAVLGTTTHQEGDAAYVASDFLATGLATSAADIFSLGLAVYAVAANTSLPASGPAWHALRTMPLAFSALDDHTNHLLARAIAHDPSRRPSAAAVAASEHAIAATPHAWLQFAAISDHAPAAKHPQQEQQQHH